MGLGGRILLLREPGQGPHGPSAVSLFEEDLYFMGVPGGA